VMRIESALAGCPLKQKTTPTPFISKFA